MAGKGRTGVVIAAYFLYSGLFDNAHQALEYFAHKRSSTNFGVNFPGQKRYVQFMEEILSGRVKELGGPVVLQKIEMHGIPRLDLSLSQLGCCPLITIYRVDQKVTGEKYGTLIYDNEKAAAVKCVAKCNLQKKKTTQRTMALQVVFGEGEQRGGDPRQRVLLGRHPRRLQTRYPNIRVCFIASTLMMAIVMTVTAL